MKTITVKSAQNIPIHSSFIIEVDDKKIGLVKVGATEYFDIEEDAKSIIFKMQGAKSNSIDISENKHHSLIINSKKQLQNGYIFSAIYLIIVLGIIFFFQINLELNLIINLSILLILYIIFKKSKLNTLQLTLIKK